MLYTILQIIAFQALFLLVYDLFLKRETFFNYNRAYLLITSILSLVLPFLKFPELKTMTTKDVVIQLPEIFIGVKAPTQYEVMLAEQTGIMLEQPQMPTWQIIVFIGIVITALIFVLKIVKLYWLKQSNPKRWKGDILIVKLIKSSAAFSFFNTIFLGEQIPETEKPTIYKHELVHIKEWHTVDLLFFELLRIVLWFNPLVYIYQNRIKELHEYIADAKAVKQNGKIAYYQSLLNQVFDVNNVSFTNTFFKKSLIKKRIAMLQKSKSKQLNLIKYALLIPLVFGMLIYTSTEVRAQEKTQKQTASVSQELTDEELIEKYYQELVSMKKEGAAFMDIYKASGINDKSNEKYILSREEFLKAKAYMRFIADGMIERKSEKGTLTEKDFDTHELMTSTGETYSGYREWKKTQEAKDLWENNTRDYVLRLFVEDASNMTKEENRRLDALLNKLEVDSSYKKVIVTDGQSTLKIDSAVVRSKNATQSIEVEESIEVPFSVIEEVPTLPECKDLPTNKERKLCMSKYVTKHVNQKFNTDIADSIGVKGRQRIFVSFKINKQGEVASVRARASHPALEEEAKRVINSLPKFIPGRQKGKLVVVPYSLPIVFQIHDDEIDQGVKSNNYKELVAQRDRLLQNTSEKNPVVVNLNKQIDSVKKALLSQNPKYDKFIEKLTQSEKEKLYLKLLEERERKAIAIKKSKATNEVVPFSMVEISPTHPDCKTIETNEERKSCTSAKVSIFINQNFNRKMAESLDLPKGRQKILGAFTIDKQGFVKDAKARAPHKKLEEEFVRVINLLPQFVPGENEGKKVNVPYSLPIVFQVADNKKKKN